MKKLIAFFLALGMSFGLCACGGGKQQTINVCNWGEYISDGADGGLRVVQEFEKRTGIKVNYTTFDTNESLYAKLSGGGASYDVIIPSDYMIQRLIAEDGLETLDYGKIPNAKYIMEEYRDLYYDPQGTHSVPYTIGMVGLIYNKTLVAEPPASWGALWDPRYQGQMLQFQSPRDAFGTAQYLLGLNVNSTDEAEWRAAAEKLKEQAPLVQSYVADEIYNIMEGANAALAPYYAGDYLMMHDNNSDLAFVYPEEGTNFFYDAMCIPKGARNLDAAHQFINFMLEPDIALANAEVIMYASPHSAVRESPDYTLKDNPVLYPETLPKVQCFENLPQSILGLMNTLWTEIKQK
ncbi:MAG: spermidine/putrescine ABC transporter substrate-binding protein [Oscillospiraceae bacterium]|nr:spermidine/putrescine ABC transporter substrate-binding protein [Oscillospiraceae bacterium]